MAAGPVTNVSPPAASLLCDNSERCGRATWDLPGTDSCVVCRLSNEVCGAVSEDKRLTPNGISNAPPPSSQHRHLISHVPTGGDPLLC
ncbi:unnamed protein product, partial [Brenthis ino]